MPAEPAGPPRLILRFSNPGVDALDVLPSLLRAYTNRTLIPSSFVQVRGGEDIIGCTRIDACMHGGGTEPYTHARTCKQAHAAQAPGEALVALGK